MFYLDLISPTKKMRIEALRKNPPLIARGIIDINIPSAHIKAKLSDKLASPELEPLFDTERFKALREKVEAL